MLSKYRRILFVMLVALIVLSVGAFNWLRPGSAHASPYTAALSAHSQMARHPGRLTMHADTCSALLALGVVGAQLFNPPPVPGLPSIQAVPISPLDLAQLQDCTP